MKTKRIMALLLCLLAVIGLMPGVASAAASTVTIESQTNRWFMARLEHASPLDRADRRGRVLRGTRGG